MAGLLYVRTGSNGGNAAVSIDDLGFTVPTGAGWTLLSASGPSDPEGSAGQFSARELRDSKDLYDLITGGTLEWSKDGSFEELPADFLSDYPLMQDFTDDFLDLTDGGFVIPNSTSLPVSGVEGQIYWDSDDNTLFIWDGTQWTSSTSSGEDHGNLTGLGDDDHLQYALLSGDGVRNAVTGKFEFATGELGLPSYTDVPGTLTTANEGDIAWDSDDDCLYLHDGTAWHQTLCLTPSGVSFPSGVALDHGELDGLFDDDHTQYGLLDGNKARNDISGEYDFTDGDLIVPADGTLTVAPVDGSIEVKGGILYTYDATRTKWLSVDRQTFLAARKSNATNVYMRTPDGIAHSETGIRVLRDATIVGIAAQTDAAESWTLEIRRNDSATIIASLVISAASGDQDATINADVDQGDELQFYINGTQVKSPVGWIELAYRTT